VRGAEEVKLLAVAGVLAAHACGRAVSADQLLGPGGADVGVEEVGGIGEAADRALDLGAEVVVDEAVVAGAEGEGVILCSSREGGHLRRDGDGYELAEGELGTARDGGGLELSGREQSRRRPYIHGMALEQRRFGFRASDLSH
jgi:hypothetical protein